MKMKSKTLRTITATIVILVVAIGFVTNWGIGTISAPGFWDISILCPLGALGTMLASKTLIPRAVISLVIMAVLIIVFSRAFCGWICPVPLVQRVRDLFAKKQTGKKDSDQGANTGKHDSEQAEDLPSSSRAAQDSEKVTAVAPLSPAEQASLKSSCSKDAEGGCASCASKRGAALDARHFVLGGALVSTAVFGFPVFCLVCPIGLTFATILLVINLFAHGDVSWTVVVVPALLVVEVVLFRKWCHKLCPLSALMSLIAKANRTFVPTIDDTKCLETSKGHTCGACGRACPEGIDPRHPQLSEAAWSECLKCRACVDACPTHAISMPLLPKKRPTSGSTVPATPPAGESEPDPAPVAVSAVADADKAGAAKV